MNHESLRQGRLSAMLAALLLFAFLNPGLSVNANETTPTIPQSTTASTEASAETSEATIPETSAVEMAETIAETLADDPPSSPEEYWCPTSPEEILPTDILVITITKGDRIWALYNGNGTWEAPTAVPVTAENGILKTQSDGLHWYLEQDGSRFTLHPEGEETFLYTLNGRDSLRIGSGQSPYWEPASNTLRYTRPKWYLQVDTASGSWTAKSQAAAGQVLTFWRQARSAPVLAEPQSGQVSPGTAVTLSCSQTGAAIYYATSSDGMDYTEFTGYTAPIPLNEGFGCLYIKAYAAAPDLPASPETVFSYTEAVSDPPEPPPEFDWQLDQNFYFGQLHAHTSISDGLGSVTEAFQYAAGVAGLDFFAVTDHSDSFDNAGLGEISKDGAAVSQKWAEGQAAAAAATTSDFVGIFGYEFSWSEDKQLGHITTLATPGWQSREQEGFDTLEDYYNALVSVPGAIGQFNHPGNFYGNFRNFSSYDPSYDRQMALLEVGGEDDFRAYDAYTQALDAGWHVAPANNQSNHKQNWGTASNARTVVLAETLSRESLLDAIRSRRVYASDDGDLEIYYTLNEHPMGSILAPVEETVIHAYLRDPTDRALGLVEILVDGGAVAASRTVDQNQAELTISVPAGRSYYYLKITQPDGDVAVTAPVWVDSFQDLGIQQIAADTNLPTQGQEITFTVTLFNNESHGLEIQNVEFFVDGELLSQIPAPGKVDPLGTLACSFSYTHAGLGITEFRVCATGTILGQERSFEKTMTLNYHAQKQVADILVDGSHGNFGTSSLKNLSALAARVDLNMTIFTQGLPESGTLLLISAPEGEFQDPFLASVRGFLEKGGSLLLCGKEGHISQLNRLLAFLDVPLRLEDAALPASAHPQRYHSSASLSRLWRKNQVFRHSGGCSVLPGRGTWLVKHRDTGHTLLAMDHTSYSGTIFVAGSLFLSDENLLLPESKWETPSVNQALLESLLNIHRPQLPLNTIEDVRNGTMGEVYRVQGYVTSGTSNPYTTFPDTLCIQDDSGGIPLVSFQDTGIQVGAPVDAIGYLAKKNGNLVLELIDYSLRSTHYYRHVPKTIPCAAAMDYAARGGRLLQVEGKVTDLTLTEDGEGVSRLVIRDFLGDTATVVIGDGIFSGSRGVNDLASQVKKGRTVRAMGILFLDEEGEPMLRVRNCEEVVYVPPIPDRTNPKTGDGFVVVLSCCITALVVCFCIKIRKVSQKSKIRIP